ncbi:NifB/NifX family molybdenum-iron cluster-binding protein [Eubacterium xylanophilum]|uniref:NifB/NifX family molybdenum-iron cluster-binding protein n=1 Tax=Eubacterium xylanophilum TaxID=39497 RepID=UPI00047E4B10|nr:NifB/NifX family molybdenum-iron cluster-binding protein [Eubacterium xylanophilum]
MSAVRVAAATTDGSKVDTHFGQAKRVFIYDIDLEDGTFHKVEERVLNIAQSEDRGTFSCEKSDRKCSDRGDNGCIGHDSEKLDAVGRELSDCQYFLVSKIGPKPQKILLRYEVNALETDFSVEDALRRLANFLIK